MADLSEQKDIHTDIDKLFEGKSIEIERVKDNIKFLDKIQEEPIEPGKHTVNVFGVETVDVSAILKDNIWNRSIYTTDKLCRLFLGATLEQLKKYEKKRRLPSFNMMWLLLIIAIPIVIVVVLMLFGGL